MTVERRTPAPVLDLSRPGALEVEIDVAEAAEVLMSICAVADAEHHDTFDLGAEFLARRFPTIVASCLAAGIDVLFDDRDARPGVKFADAELIGVPHRLVISERGLEAGELEYRHRRDTDSRLLKREDALDLLRKPRLS